MKNIICTGCSCTSGVYNDINSSYLYSSILKNRLDARKYVVYNAGVSGCGLIHCINSFKNKSQEYLGKNPDICILQLPEFLRQPQNADTRNVTDNYVTSYLNNKLNKMNLLEMCDKLIEEDYNRLATFIENNKEIGTETIIILYYYITYDILNFASFFYDKYFNIVVKYLNENNVKHTGILKQSYFNKMGWTLSDGDIHPNAIGNDKICDILIDLIENRKINITKQCN